MPGLKKAEALLEEYLNSDKSNRLSGTGRVAHEILTDPKKFKDFQKEQGQYGYMRLVVQCSNPTFQKRFPKDYMEYNKYLYEVPYGKPATIITADFGENLPLNVTFQVAAKPAVVEGKFKELTDGKTTNGTEATEGISGTEKETI